MSRFKHVIRDSNQDGDTYILELVSPGHAVYVCLHNEADYDFFLSAAIYIDWETHTVYMDSGAVWWKNSEWNNVKLFRGDLSYMLKLAQSNDIDMSIVYTGLQKVFFDTTWKILINTQTNDKRPDMLENIGHELLEMQITPL